MKQPRRHLRLTYRKQTPSAPGDSHLQASRKRLLGLALGASLAGAGCGDFEPIPAPDASIVAPDASERDDSGIVPPMAPPQDAGEFRDAGSDAGDETDAGSNDVGDETDAGEQDSGPFDAGEVPPMPPPRDSGTSPRDTGTSPRDTGTSQRDTGTSPRDTGIVIRDIARPPMPPPRRDTNRPR